MGADPERDGDTAPFPTDPNLHRFVAGVREAQRMVYRADSLLYGIFGHAKDSPERARRIANAHLLVDAAVRELTEWNDGTKEVARGADAP